MSSEHSISRFFYSVWADPKLIVTSLNSELLIIDRVSDNENSYKNVINEKIKLVLGWALCLENGACLCCISLDFA
jgi:hypothetical protein